MPIFAAETTPVTTPVTTPEKSTKATAEARQRREFKRHDPVKFFGGTDVMYRRAFPEESREDSYYHRDRGSHESDDFLIYAPGGSG
ncbi:hypothetical protein Sjap_024863 [Stephania japonica]|uniref:Uncharacterized protein n=1 Tax=Stephania japonica TaxID=461633 RepID=A0AAP0EE45_9MAGN